MTEDDGDDEGTLRDAASQCASDARDLNAQMAVAFAEGRVDDGVRLGGEAVAMAARGVMLAARAAMARKREMH